MSTAKELGYREGDLAIYASAELDSPIQRSDGTTVMPGKKSGIPLDTPGAEVTVVLGKVLEANAPILSPDGAFLSAGTRLEVVWSSNGNKNPGEVTILDQRFRNFVGPNDDRLLNELRRASASTTASRE